MYKRIARWLPTAIGFAAGALALATPASAQTAGKPNILVIMGDDIGLWNISAYNRGQMGYRTPNIDRIANEGAIFTDYYGQQSCTAGRAAFITGQSPVRTGLLKVGLPGAPEGLSEKDPTIADLLKPRGYATGQFGKNHLGDRNEFLPTVHGFDEFFGNLYHLNAEEEPENVDYPKDPTFKAADRPRGVLKCVATPNETPGEDPRFGKWGKQKCEDTGPLTQKRMETIDGEFLTASLDFIDRVNRDTEVVLRSGSTRAACISRVDLHEGGRRQHGLGVYADGMREHDNQVGELLKKLDDLKIADNTIVIYTTDNGAEVMSWPDGGSTPFRGEKTLTGKVAIVCPAMVRWPGLVKPGSEINEISRPRIGLALPRRSWRTGLAGQAQAGCNVRRQDFQGLPRWLRPARTAEERQRRRAQGVLLLDGRRRPGGAALQQVEACLHGTTLSWLRRLAGPDE